MYIAILGRQPELGIAELEQLYGNVSWFSDTTALVNFDKPDLSRLGGSQKIGRVVAELPSGDWTRASRQLVSAYQAAWQNHDGKITLGLSAFGFGSRISAREVQKTGIILKQKLKQSGVSLRLVPNDGPALSTATGHHNKLGLSDNKVELIVVRAKNGRIVIAESIGSQNITAYAKRDQGRPKRDAFVGMLPPKLAQMMINMANGSCKVEDGSQKQTPPSNSHLPSSILDPFCGTGVILQEAALMGYSVYGTDLAPKMIEFTGQNLDWLNNTHRVEVNSRLEQGDATDYVWRRPIDAVVCESYLGQPFSAPPSPAKLREVRGNCNHIIGNFLKNIGSQIEPGTPLCVAVPAWRSTDGSFTHLPLIGQLKQLGYTQVELKTVKSHQLLYYREDQVVARELLLLVKA